MTTHSPPQIPSPSEALIEQARVARLEHQAVRIAAHLRVILSRLNSRAPKLASEGM
jgi:hypothetical protein